MKSFHNKVAAITGAGSGIGRGLAVELARRGCHLSLSDINEAGLAETVALVKDAGVKVTSQPVDVANRDAIYAWAEETATAHGRVNLIFNNAGVALTASMEGVPYDDFEWIIGINFWGVIYGTKAFLPHLKASGDGHVVNLSSVFGLMGVPTQGAYNCAKFAVRGFTECLRQELDLNPCGVSATSVHPGGIKTNIARAGRVHESALAYGMDVENSGDNFEKSALTTPAKAANIILRAVEQNKRRCLVGPDAHLIDWMVRLFPTGYPWVIRKVLLSRM